MEGIEFTEPVPEINNAKNRVKAAHIQHEKKIKEEQNQKGVGNSVRLERDKPFDPFGLAKDSQTHGNHHHHHQGQHQQHRQPTKAPLNFGFTRSPLTKHVAGVSFTSTSPLLTQHNSLTLGTLLKVTRKYVYPPHRVYRIEAALQSEMVDSK